MDLSPLWISLQVALSATVITFVTGVYAAIKLVNSHKRRAGVFDIIITLPLVLPPTVVGLILLLVFGRNGFLGKLLFHIGVQIVFTKTAAVIAAFIVSFPLMYRSAKAAMEQADQNLIYAGRTLGLTENRIFFRILLPIAAPGIASGVILAFARALGEFGATMMIAGNIPKITQTMPLAIYMSIQGGNTKAAIYWGLLLIILSFIMMYLINKISSGKMRLGGL